MNEVIYKTGKNNHIGVVRQEWQRNKELYIMILPVLIYFVIFMYVPMYGAVIAFKNYTPFKGIWHSDWVGLENFKNFFGSIYFFRVLKNTFLLSFYSLLWGFPAPIVFALLLNEVRGKWFKKTVQTITYLPHFVSLVVIIGLLKEFTVSTGLVNDILTFIGLERFPLLQKPEAFRTLYITSDLWQSLGWNSIIYLAALSGVDPQLYEAARIDGANRWQQVLHVTLPSIQNTIAILLILRMGTLFTVGFEKIILMYNPSTYEVSDVISSFVYRSGILNMNFSYSTAVGLFNSMMNFILLVTANRMSRWIGKTSLW